MDRIESLGTQLSQITMYDLKSYYNQAKNIVLNVSEMEAKVREATNEDPWGASSTLMQDIAQGTFNFQNFNEIMPCIYSRFMEKEASQWRQIYKALQLLEYIIKHGSERVVDDARSHISTIKMLRNFHYIDEKAKDQGINVRTRAKELAELLSDLDRVRVERRKAKANRNKYTGAGNDEVSFNSGGSRYGGFGNDTGGYGGGYDNDYPGGGSGSGGGSSFRDESGRRPTFDEYDAGDYEEGPKLSNSTPSRRAGSSGTSRPSRTAAPAPPVASPAKEVDLLGGFGDYEAPLPPVSKPLPNPTANVSLDDDFDDFQSAPPVAAPVLAAPVIAPSTSKPSMNVFDMIGTTPISSAASSTPLKNGSSWAATPIEPTSKPVAARPNYTSSTSSSYGVMASSSTGSPLSVTAANSTASKTASSGDFDDLWNLGLGSSSAVPSRSSGPSTRGKSIKDLEKEKSDVGMWGATNKSSVASFPSFAGASNADTNDGDLL